MFPTWPSQVITIITYISRYNELCLPFYNHQAFILKKEDSANCHLQMIIICLGPPGTNESQCMSHLSFLSSLTDPNAVVTIETEVTGRDSTSL